MQGLHFLNSVWIIGSADCLPRDHLFASPSMAAVALQGRSANGWLEWKRLDEVKRQSVTGAG